MDDKEFTEFVLYMAERASDYAKFNELVKDIDEDSLHF